MPKRCLFLFIGYSLHVDPINSRTGLFGAEAKWIIIVLDVLVESLLPALMPELSREQRSGVLFISRIGGGGLQLKQSTDRWYVSSLQN